jgi:hypothetical protein
LTGHITLMCRVVRPVHGLAWIISNVHLNCKRRRDRFSRIVVSERKWLAGKWLMASKGSGSEVWGTGEVAVKPLVFPNFSAAAGRKTRKPRAFSKCVQNPSHGTPKNVEFIEFFTCGEPGLVA